MAIKVNGTFSETGNSTSLTASKAAIHLTFVGTATVNLQWNLDGTNWRTIGSYTATTSDGVYYDGPRVPLRLNCSAHTDNVAYEMVSGD